MGDSRDARSGRKGGGPSADSLLERQPPQAVDVERAVLGSLLLLPQACDEVALILRPDDFYDDANARVYAQVLAMHDAGQQVDVMLLVQRLKDAGEYEAVGGGAYLAEVGASVTTAAHAEHYAGIVREKSMLRSLIHASTDILKDAYDPSVEPRQMLSRAEEKVFAILEDKGQGQVNPIRDVLQASLERIDARMKHEHAFGGLETGFDDFDDLTGGMHASELIILAARPSMGKTALALNIMEHVAIDCQQPTLFVSLEMSALELGDRQHCSRARVNTNPRRNRKKNPHQSRQHLETAAQ
ncbi:MAG: DnaB-like helicase N-terminal domain-containing protein, partial [Planctomycetota bacterium]